jgi:hypothetical protein
MPKLSALLMLAVVAGVNPPELRHSSPITPGVRNAHGLAFDARRGRVVLFGGADASAVRDDTWEYDGRVWHNVAGRGPGRAPSPP